MSLLLPDTGLLFWMLLIFIIVFALLAKFGFPMITSMLDKRKEYIEHSLELAKEADAKMGRMMEEQSKMIEQARTEQNRILKEASDARDAIISKAKEQARDEAGKILSETRARIQAEKESAMSEIRSQVAMLSVDVAERIVRTHLSADKAQMELVDKMLDEAVAASDKNAN